MNEKPSPRSAAPAGAVAASPTPTESKPRTEGSILLATNGSEEGDAATKFASALARRDGVPLRIVTVLEPLPSLPSEFAISAHHFDIERERGEEVLTKAKAQALAELDDELVETSMLMGSPAGTIGSAARSWRSAYVVLGAGRRGRVERLFAGDTAVRVLRDAIVPVIAVPATCGELPRVAVAAVDFGPASMHAARAAADLVQEGVVHLMHVRPEIDVPATDPSVWGDLYEAGARTLLSRLAKELATTHPRIRFETELGRGHAAKVVLDHASTIGAELIAVGQHARGTVERLLFGSVASGIVRSAGCTVVVAPPANVDS